MRSPIAVPHLPAEESAGRTPTSLEKETLALEIAEIICERVTPKQLVKLSQHVFLTVEETAEILRVKPKTVHTWISQGRIPVRYAGGRPIFLLAELLHWTLPPDDIHQEHRLPSVKVGKIDRND